MPNSQQEKIRLQKFLAQAGIASRRKAEEIILQGRVSVNGQTVDILGTSVDPQADQVCLDGKPVKTAKRCITFILNKPVGLICSANEAQGDTIFSLFKGKCNERLFSVGRLDKYSEGLLLVTNDGALAQHLTHPRHGHTKTYDVTVNGEVSDAQLAKLQAPMRMDDYQTKPAKVAILPKSREPNTTTLRIILQEGRSRQIRNLCAECKLPIRRLRRIRIGQLELGPLKSGCFRPLLPNERALLEKPDRLRPPIRTP